MWDLPDFSSPDYAHLDGPQWHKLNLNDEQRIVMRELRWFDIWGHPHMNPPSREQWRHELATKALEVGLTWGHIAGALGRRA